MFVLTTPVFGIYKAHSKSSEAVLTGNIFDRGVDVDSDGLFDYLEVGVETNVSEAGNYWVKVNALFSSDYEYINVENTQLVSLNVGVQVFYIPLNGSTIYTSGLNPAKVSYISLRDEGGNLFGSLYGVPLSREYLYTEFETPAAALTGVIHDQGVDADGNGALDYLQIGVEVNVTKAGNYIIVVNGLPASNGYIDVGFSQLATLEVGVQVVPIPLNGTTIYASGLNPANVSYISLNDEHAYFLGELREIPLSRTYSYTEFEAPVSMKTPSALSCSVSKDTIMQGQSIVVSGTLNVTLSGKTVTLTYRKPDSSAMNRTVTTDSDGSYSDSYTPDATGSWSITASWEGDSTYNGATSSSRSFIVNAVPFIETTLGMAMIGGGIVLIVIVVVVLVLRKRKT